MINLNSLHTGDELISANSQKSLIKHHGVVLIHPITKTRMVVDNNIDEGVKIHPLEVYMNENTIIKVNKFYGTSEQEINLFWRAISLVGVTYSILKFNCEHCANLLRNGKMFSKQLQIFYIVAAIIILFVVFYKPIKRLFSKQTNCQV